MAQRCGPAVQPFLAVQGPVLGPVQIGACWNVHSKDKRRWWGRVILFSRKGNAHIAGAGINQPSGQEVCGDNCPSSSDLAEYLQDKGMKHVRGAPMHPQTRGKLNHQRQAA